MVAIVSGSSLGLSLGSLRTLGQQGVFGSAAQGRSGEQAYVNVATGNLVLQHRDELLSGRGLDIERVALDRVTDEDGRQIKATSLEGTRTLNREEIERILETDL